MRDARIDKLAELLVNYSCELKKGEKVLIEAHDIDSELVVALVEKAYAAGGFPFVKIIDKRVDRAILNGLTEQAAALMRKYDSYRMEDMDAYIGIRGGNNSYELSDVPSVNNQIYQREYMLPVHHEIRVKKTKWVVLRYPNPGMAQLAGMSTEAFENFYFDVCTLDYRKMDKAMDALGALLNKTDRVRLIAKDTDLNFSIKGIGSNKCSGRRNIPDGEIYSAPVKDSVNGKITFNAPSIEQGLKHEHISLKFKDGKVIEATSNFTKELNAILDTDEGARYVGEFSLGINPYILTPMGDILFDEKICGSIHFTPGACYDDCYNGNKSSIHWDMVLIMTKEYGGGEIWFDDVLIRKDGRFVIKELECLNPENLK